MSESIHVVHCGLVPYMEAYELQERLRERRQHGEIGDTLLLLEHPPVYTRGRRATAEELPMGVEWYERQGIEVHDTERGGRVTYHGPGQLVAYPIVSLDAHGGDVLEYVRNLERAMIAAIGDFGVEAGLIKGETGVWVHGGGPARKIGAIGLHISRGVTTHGLAINVNNDLQPFEWVVPCGIEGCAVTSVARERGAEQDFESFAAALTRRYGETFDREPMPTELGALGPERAPASLG
ncbi:MAG TPA: lipoyl(octanoyl) transferase LipB [Solirubrobacterales bacterium]